MRLRALLDTGTLGLRLLAGQDQLDRPVRGVMTTDLRDPSRYLSGGELVLTGLAWRRGAADSERFVRLLADAQVAGLAAGEAELGPVPEDLTAACRQHRVPLFAVDEAVSFADITEHVVRQVSGERAGDLAAIVDRHRRLMADGPSGDGPQAVLELLGSDLDLTAWLLSPTGRQITGSRPGRLPADTGRRLAARHLAAARTGRRGPYPVTVDSVPYALFPVSTAESGDARRTALSDWLLAVAEDVSEWPAERIGLLDGVTRLIAVERLRQDATLGVRRRLAQEVLDLVQAGAPPAEVATRLRLAAAEPDPAAAEPCWQVVVARLEWATGPDGRREPRTGEGAPGAGPGDGAAGQALLEELLSDPAVTGREVAVAHTEDGEAVALVPRAAGTRGPDGRTAEPLRAETVLGAVRPILAAALAEDGRFTLGVSAAVTSADGLHGALEEARHGRRVAAARGERVSGAGHEELASHVLLLPFVPDDVRRAFTARLLDPLREYDRRHRSELVPTLEGFLESDGSWTRCAARLHVHVNTLRYRISRIEQLTGRDLSRLEDKLDFFLALRMN
jgi:hypothetical protein